MKPTEKIDSFEKSSAVNIPGYRGLSIGGYTTWYTILQDLAISLYTWNGNFPFHDKLKIEEYIQGRIDFAMIETLIDLPGCYIKQPPRIFRVIGNFNGFDNQPTSVTIVDPILPEGMIRTYETGFVFYENRVRTRPDELVIKYATMLSKLDALYDQHVEKQGVPLMLLVDKSLKNQLINLMKKTVNNALFAFLAKEKVKSGDLFYDFKVEYILDKINSERQKLMKEFIETQGTNPNRDNESSQYTSVPEMRENSIVSKFFAAVQNKYRTNFVDLCNAKWDYLNMSYEPTVKTYADVTTEVLTTGIKGGLENGASE